MDPFALNIQGASDIVKNPTNKTANNGNFDAEGVQSELEDVLTLKLDDQELLDLKTIWEGKHNGYYPKVKARQEKNKTYYLGRQKSKFGNEDTIIPSNLLFESEETFIPQALSQNPEPVVWSDNTVEGKQMSNDVKTMLQYHADILTLRRKLGVMVRHWSIYFLGVVKHGYDSKINDIKTEIRKPQNFVLDPDGYINEYGDYIGTFLGERIEVTARKLVEMFPDSKDYILIKTDGKLGTLVKYTEWWTNEYSFSTFEDKILDKHKNPYFNYDQVTKNSEEDQIEYGLEAETVTPAKNHFAVPKMPYTFLSVFSLQENPHDVTNLIEQNIPNQDRITERDDQITKNLKHGNNSIAVSGISFTSETAREAAQALEDGDPVLIPDGNVESGLKRIPANQIPSSVFEAQNIDKTTLRSVFGVQGLSAQPQNSSTTARGMILNQSHDSTRIGGGIGDALEQVADNIFNWWLQLYYVFYDEAHYGAVMGSGRAVEYVMLTNSNINRHFVVSVAPNSMKPKDEITEQNLAIELANTGWLDPINLFRKLDYPDPMETAKMVTMFKINPQQYYMTYFPEQAQTQQTMQVSGNPPDMSQMQGEVPSTLGSPPASSALSQVPLSTNAMPQ